MAAARNGSDEILPPATFEKIRHLLTPDEELEYQALLEQADCRDPEAVRRLGRWVVRIVAKYVERPQ
ncbi:MAG: hypothetical protein ACYTDY_12320 [Planctomycetota bacterium]|jgi:hypothetical protein